MQKKTHLAVGLALGLYFVPFVTQKILFIPLVLLASLLPDVDSTSSELGRRKIFRPMQVLFEHRGPLHSYTACILASILLTFLLPTFSLPLFLGYSFHLFLDSFTVMGIRPFWPLKFTSSGKVKSGGVVDRTLLWVFVVIDIFLLIKLFT